MKLSTVVCVLLSGSCCITAAAEQTPAEIDAVMVKIYAADAGTKCKGDWHQRSISRGTDWSTSPSHFTCKATGALTQTCEGTDDEGSDKEVNWVAKFRVKDGVEYQDVTLDKGEPWSRKYKISDAWFTDADNYGGTRTWTDTVPANDVTYEGIDTMLQMGDRWIFMRKLRKQGSDDRYQYNQMGNVSCQ